MPTILGDESEEKLRKGELKSILNAALYGFVLGGLIGGVLAGYGGLLWGLFAGAFAMSLFSILGVKAIRREKQRQTLRSGAAEPRGSKAAVPRRRLGPPR
jgi:predicted lipid-binding transport protein (Tim44 family)